jgi:hypothetical protein
MMQHLVPTPATPANDYRGYVNTACVNDAILEPCEHAFAYFYVTSTA